MSRSLKPKSKYHVLLAFCISFVLLALPCIAEEQPQVKTAEKPRLPSLQKSLILPGWGQLAEKKYARGIFFLSAEIFCVYQAFHFNSKGNDAYEQYKNAGNVDDAVRFRQLTEDHDTRRNQHMLLAVGVWAVNLLDIFLIHKKKERKDKDLQVSIEKSDKKSLALTVSYSF